MVLGQGHLRRIVTDYAAHYLYERNHQGLDNELIESSQPAANDNGEIGCRQRLGGVAEVLPPRGRVGMHPINGRDAGRLLGVLVLPAFGVLHDAVHRAVRDCLRLRCHGDRHPPHRTRQRDQLPYPRLGQLQIRDFVAFDGRPRFLLHDNEGVFGQLGRRRECFRCHLDRWLSTTMATEGLPIPYHAPNANAHVERFHRTLRQGLDGRQAREVLAPHGAGAALRSRASGTCGLSSCAPSPSCASLCGAQAAGVEDALAIVPYVSGFSSLGRQGQPPLRVNESSTHRGRAVLETQ